MIPENECDGLNQQERLNLTREKLVPRLDLDRHCTPSSRPTAYGSSLHHTQISAQTLPRQGLVQQGAQRVKMLAA